MRAAMEDNPALLEQMFADMAAANSLYQPTNYWQVYQDRLMPLILTRGISRFRSRDLLETSRFGVSQFPTAFLLENEPGRIYKAAFSKLLARYWSHERRWLHHVDLFRNSFRSSHELLVRWLTDIDPKQELQTIEDSGRGDPTDVVEVTGRRYTVSFLRYFSDYLWLRERAPFADFRIVLELGVGYGGQAEVVKKLHPNLTYVVCDIPPQLYIAEQYLRSVFPGEVVGYQTTRPADSLAIEPDGHIHVIQPFQLEHLEFSGGLDLFHSVASMQEMEPTVVANYLALVVRFLTAWVYLVQNPQGKQVARVPGEPGVLTPVTYDDYLRNLQSYDLTDEAPAWLFNSTAARGFELTNEEFIRMLFQRKGG